MELLQLLPDFGTLGALIALVVFLVITFLRYMRALTDQVIEIHNKTIDVITDNTAALIELRSEIRILKEKVIAHA